MATKLGLLGLLMGLLLSSCAPAVGQVVIRGGYYGAPRPYYSYYGPRYYPPRPPVVVVPAPVVVYPGPYFAPAPRVYYPGRPHRWGGYGWRR